MSSVEYPIGVPYREGRPRDSNGLAGMTIGAILGLLITKNAAGGIVGGAVGGAVGSTPLSLEAAVRSYFTSKGFPVIGFYRLGPRAAQVLFRSGQQYWTVISRAPEAQNWTLEALDDWLYGDLVACQLPAKLAEISNRLAS